METKNFNFTDVLGYGWRVMKANLWFFVGLGFVWIVISYIPAVINGILENMVLPEPMFWTFYVAMTILSWVIGIIFGIGLIKIALSFCDEKKPRLVTLFKARGCFWRYVGVTILYILIMYGGFILLIFPGVIWAIKFKLCQYFVIDKGLGPIQALKASARTTKGVKLELFGFWIMCILINLAGLACLVVGIFAAYPTVIVASALVYRQLLAQTPELAEFGIGGADVLPNPNWSTSAEEKEPFSHLQ